MSTRADNNDMEKKMLFHEKNLIFYEVNGPQRWSVMYKN